jgi:hypothetical protein
MMDRFWRGWAMAKASYAVLRRYPKLAIFPVISGAFLILILGVIGLSMFPDQSPLHPFLDRLGSSDTGQYAFYAAAAVVLYVVAVVSLFCNVALVHCALRCHAGQDASVSEGIAAATTRLPQILGWALIAMTVGILLNVIQSFLRDKLGFLGSFIGGLFEFGWATVTYFVLPVLAAEGAGPIAALRRSSSILKAKWGESLAGEARFGLLGILFVLVAALIFFLGLAVALSHGAGAYLGLGPVLMAIGFGVGLASIVVLQALNVIFQAGVYLYATTGQVPPSLDPGLVQGAFRPKG